MDQPMIVFDVSAGYSTADCDFSGGKVLMMSLAFQECRFQEFKGPHVQSS